MNLLRDIIRDIPRTVSSMRSRIRSESEATKKMKVSDGDRDPARISNGLLCLPLSEWKDIEKQFAVITERRKGTPKV